MLVQVRPGSEPVALSGKSGWQICLRPIWRNAPGPFAEAQQNSGLCLHALRPFTECGHCLLPKKQAFTRQLYC